MTVNLNDQVALVTGGTRGIGRAIALRLAASGATVVVTARSEPSAELIDELKSAGAPDAAGFAGDVADFARAAEIVTDTVKRFGRLDILVNNAGLTKDGLLLRMSEADWDVVLDANLKGAFNFTRAAVGPMVRQRRGRIVNLTSVVGLTGNAGQVNYAASKAGLLGLTKSVAKELASRNITCNAVAPGYITTEMTDHLTDAQRAAFLTNIPLNRPGTGDDVAGVVLFLVSTAAAYLTGQTLHVDGGLVM